MSALNRRKFIQTAGLSALPVLIPGGSAFAGKGHEASPLDGIPDVKLFGDGEIFDVSTYIEELKKINTASAIEPDRYASGGVVAALEKKFEEITGKEKAVYMTSGTMANQLAISVLSGDNAKVFVQETSHVFRDEADAAQSVFGKRLIPLAQGECYFTSQQLQEALNYHKEGEVFNSGVGCISVENPVRRADGRMIPLEEIKNIKKVCTENNIRMHLDGARIYMASGWSGVSIKEYASYFDTIYISLYKYLGAASGAILCGSKEVMGKMEHLIKVHGGSMYRNWTSAAMALQRLEGVESRLQAAIGRSKDLFTALNKIPGINITALPDGTNIYIMTLAKNVNGKKLSETLSKQFGIRMGGPDTENRVKISVNETLLYRDNNYMVGAFDAAVKAPGPE